MWSTSSCLCPGDAVQLPQQQVMEVTRSTVSKYSVTAFPAAALFPLASATHWSRRSWLSGMENTGDLSFLGLFARGSYGTKSTPWSARVLAGATGGVRTLGEAGVERVKELPGRREAVTVEEEEEEREDGGRRVGRGGCLVNLGVAPPVQKLKFVKEEGEVEGVVVEGGGEEGEEEAVVEEEEEAGNGDNGGRRRGIVVDVDCDDDDARGADAVENDPSCIVDDVILVSMVTFGRGGAVAGENWENWEDEDI